MTTFNILIHSLQIIRSFCLITIDLYCVRHNLVIQMWMKSLSTSTKVQIRVIYLNFRPYPHYMYFVFKHTNMMMFSIKDPGGHVQICHIFQTCSNRSRTVVQILVGSKKEQICVISFCQNEYNFFNIMSLPCMLSADFVF